MQCLVISANPVDKSLIHLLQGFVAVTQELVPDRPEHTFHLASALGFYMKELDKLLSSFNFYCGPKPG